MRHNIRTLRGEYASERVWRMLLRYLFEFQYLRFSRIADPRGFFFHSTSFHHDFIAAGLCDEPTFDGLTHSVRTLCDTYAVDEARFRFPPPLT